MISWWTRSASVQAMLPNWSLNAVRMFDSRSISGSGYTATAGGRHRLDLGVLVGSGNFIAACFSTR